MTYCCSTPRLIPFLTCAGEPNALTFPPLDENDDDAPNFLSHLTRVPMCELSGLARTRRWCWDRGHVRVRQVVTHTPKPNSCTLLYETTLLV
jgi:hypothetical protein